MIGLAFDNLKAPLYTTLSGNAGLVALSADVYSRVPPDAAFPYVKIGPPTEAPDLRLTTHDSDAATVTVTLDVFDNQEKRAWQVANAVHAALHRSTIAVTGFGTLPVEREFVTMIEESDVPGNPIYHIPMRYRFRFYEV